MSNVKNAEKQTEGSKARQEKKSTKDGEKIDKILLLLDIGVFIVPAMLTLGTALLLLDIMRWFSNLGIVEKNFFTALGWIALLLFYTMRTWLFFDRRLNNIRRNYKDE